jgi:hypothetical protein
MPLPAGYDKKSFPVLFIGTPGYELEERIDDQSYSSLISSR